MEPPAPDFSNHWKGVHNMKPNQTRDLIFSILYHHHRHLKPDQLRFLESCYTYTQTPARPRQLSRSITWHITDETRRLPTARQRKLDAIVEDLRRRGLSIKPAPKV